MEIDEPSKSKANPTAYDLLSATRTAMEDLAAKMLFLKKEAKPKSELKEIITNMSLLLIALRQVNRNILLEEDRVKAETESAKAPVDYTTLQLHNLMYEKNHYLKAIKACKDFKSKYPDIDLVPEEEFFSNAPEDIKGKALASDPTHDLMLKRLNFELFQRKELCKRHEKLEEHKRSLLETIANRKKFLSSLPSHLKSLKKASLPVQQQLGIQHTKKLKQHNAAELLPPPLYVLYSQLLAQKEAFGEKIELEILGSTKDALTFCQQQANKTSGTLMNKENKIEDDAADDDEDGQRRRKRPKKIMEFKDKIDHSAIYQAHPLKVALFIYDDEDSEPNLSKLITLKFEYLVKLNVVSVGIEGEEGSEDILCNLFPDDTGMELPHQMASLYVGDPGYINEKKASRPYKWAQHLGGIDFLPELPESSMKSDKVRSGLSLYRHQNRLNTVLQRIRSRKKAQLALVEQLESLAKLKFPSLSYKNVPWASHIPSCTLQHWSLTGQIMKPSSLNAIEQAPNSNSNTNGRERRSVTPWEDKESTREDGELPVAPLASTTPEEHVKTLDTSNSFSDIEHSRGLALISKCITPRQMNKSQSFSKCDDDLELMVDSESDVDEQTFDMLESENVIIDGENQWEEYGTKEYNLVLAQKDKDGKTVKLEAKVKISMEYPLRPPFFTLSLSSDDSGYHEELFNELRAMESKVNLHILKMLPLECENHIVSHQVKCLAMLFEFHLDTQNDRKTSTSIMDVGLSEPVSGNMHARSVRGRDRRKMIYWKGTQCSLGYPG